MVGCVFLYTIFGLFLVRLHADKIASKMHLFLLNSMTPLIMPDDRYLQGFDHQLGNALFFGIMLGPLAALLTSIISVVPWIRGYWGKRIDILLVVVIIPILIRLMFSNEMPVLSILCGMVTPFFFLVPWALVVRRSTARRRNHLCLLLCALIFLPPVFLLKDLSLLDIRNALFDLSITRRMMNLYYNHTLVAAHVITPVRNQTQSVIAASDDIEVVGVLPHGTLWIKDPDPCGIKGSSLVVSVRPLHCPSLVLPAPGSAKQAGEIIYDGSKQFDDNRAIRRSIRLFLHGPLIFVFFLIDVWLVLFVEDVFRCKKALALLLITGFLLASGPLLYHTHLVHVVSRDVYKVHEYASSGNAEKRYIILHHFPNTLTNDELESMAGDTSPKVRHYAYILMGQRREKSFLDALEKGADDRELIVRTKVCWALGEIGGEDALRLLDRVIDKDPSWYVRQYAYNAKSNLKPVSKLVKGT